MLWSALGWSATQRNKWWLQWSQQRKKELMLWNSVLLLSLVSLRLNAFSGSETCLQLWRLGNVTNTLHLLFLFWLLGSCIFDDVFVSAWFIGLWNGSILMYTFLVHFHVFDRYKRKYILRYLLRLSYSRISNDVLCPAWFIGLWNSSILMYMFLVHFHVRDHYKREYILKYLFRLSFSHISSGVLRPAWFIAL